MNFENLARSSLQRVEIRTAYGPNIVLKEPLKKNGEPNPLMEALKPEIELTFATGNRLKLAPYGNPGPTKWPQISAGVKVGGLLAAIAVGAWAFKRLKQ